MDLPVGVDRVIQSKLEELERKIDKIAQARIVTMGGRKLTAVAPGTDGSDAVTLGQLKKELQKLQTTLEQQIDAIRKGTT